LVTAEIWLTPAMDVYIAEFYPDKNFCDSPFLYSNRFQGCGDIYRFLLKFDLCSLECNFIPPNSTIKYAHLLLPVDRNEVPCENTLYVYRVFQDWCECGVTWNNQPGIASPAEGKVKVSAGFFGTLKIDITNLVESWYDGFYKNFGVLLTCDESFDSLLGFFSTRYPNSDVSPRIRIGYSQNCCEEKRKPRSCRFDE
jgi:hypothetical protein